MSVDNSPDENLDFTISKIILNPDYHEKKVRSFKITCIQVYDGSNMVEMEPFFQDRNNVQYHKYDLSISIFSDNDANQSEGTIELLLR